ncbi:unnamed protein product [Rotaria sp. Silwood2]|nr:unnamed protein product [Rotaria sp. Silwood2]
MWQTHLGIKGIIDDEDGEPIYNASIKVYQSINNNWEYIDHDVTSNPDGNYYRLLVDGTYAIKVAKPGYESQIQYVKIHNKEHQTNAQRLDFTLQTASSERISLQQILRKHMNNV